MGGEGGGELRHIGENSAGVRARVDTVIPRSR